MKGGKAAVILPLVIGACLFHAGAFALEFSVASEWALAGEDEGLAVRFAALSQGDGLAELEVEFNGKHLSALLGRGVREGEFFLEVADRSTGGTIGLSPKDRRVLGRLLAMMLRRDVSRTPLGESLVRTLALLLEWPAGRPVAASGDALAFQDGEGRRSTAAGIDDICGRVNLVHGGGYPVNGTWRQFEELGVVGPYPWDEGDCLGRCGRGCPGDGQPDNGLTIFGQDCFNHDTCVRDRPFGTIHPDCVGIFDLTIDDFLFGPSCQKDNLRILVNGRNQSVQVAPDGQLDISVSIVNAPQGVPVDFWLFARTPVGTYWYVLATGWQTGSVPVPGLQAGVRNVRDYPVYQGPLPSGFPPGVSTFYFAVDGLQDGVLPSLGRFQDALEVEVVEPLSFP